MDEPDSVDNDAGNTGITSRIKTIKQKAMLEEVTEATTRRHRIQTKAARVSRTQSGLNGFRRT